MEKLLEQRACDLIFNPTEMYHQSHSTSITLKGVAEPLEGQIRPHFFGGVATIILKLFNQIQPDIAIFGEKDYQQLLVINQFLIEKACISLFFLIRAHVMKLRHEIWCL